MFGGGPPRVGGGIGEGEGEGDLSLFCLLPVTLHLRGLILSFEKNKGQLPLFGGRRGAACDTKRYGEQNEGDASPLTILDPFDQGPWLGRCCVMRRRARALE